MLNIPMKSPDDNKNYQNADHYHEIPNIKIEDNSKLNIPSKTNLDAPLSKKKTLNIIMEHQEIAHQKELKRHNELQDFSFLGLTSRVFFALLSNSFQAILGLLACASYITETYYHDDRSKEKTFRIIEILIGTLFTVDYCYGFFKAKKKEKWFFSASNMVDLVTILPMLVYIANPKNQFEKQIGYLFGVIRIFRILRIFKAFKIARFSARNIDEIPTFDGNQFKLKVTTGLATILSMIFITAGIFQGLANIGFLEFTIIDINDQEYLTFDAAFFFLLTTLVTTPYGDIRPISVFSRVMVLAYIIMMIITIAKEVFSLAKILKLNSQFNAPYKGDSYKHIVLTGAFTQDSLLKFLKEFYHPDHNIKHKVKILILQNEPPAKEIVGVLNNPIYEGNIQYMIGSIFRQAIMKMAKIDKCRGVFILANQYVQDAKEDDTFAILASKAIKEFSPKTKTYLQVSDPSFLVHKWARWDFIMSTKSYKMGIIAGNVLNPGFSTWISNLVMSTGSSLPKELESVTWALEYTHGLSQELYCVELPEELEGLSFNAIVKDTYKITGALVLGIRTHDIKSRDHHNKNGTRKIYLNPLSYKIKKGDYAIMIAKDMENANQLDKVDDKFGDIYNYLDIRNEVHLKKLKIKKRVCESRGNLIHDHYKMWEVDLRGQVWDHILVFGKVEYITELLHFLSLNTNQYICFVSDSPPDENWDRIKKKFANAIYFECAMNTEELSHTAINFCYHVVVLTWMIPNSNIQDSGIITLIRLLEENFTATWTLEFIHESNMRYLKSRPGLVWDNVSYNMWPAYASSSIFFSSTIDYLMAQSYHNNSFLEIVDKILSDHEDLTKDDVEENCKFNTISIPPELADKCTYLQLFHHLLNRPRPVIPLGIMRSVNAYENESPVFISNPDPGTPLLKKDSILVIGDFIKQDHKNSFKINQNKYDYNYLARKNIEQDHYLKLSNSDYVDEIQEELNLTTQSKELLLEYNQKIKGLLKEYENLVEKKNVAMKKNHVQKKVQYKNLMAKDVVVLYNKVTNDELVDKVRYNSILEKLAGRENKSKKHIHHDED